jgi:hypothetical protein
LDVSGIGAAHFGASFVGGEHPVDFCASGISLSLLCVDLPCEAARTVDSAVQALAAQHCDFDLTMLRQLAAGVLWG